MAGSWTKTPRWQQAYERDYVYSGSRNGALSLAPILAPLRDWARHAVDARLNGVLVNWYDGSLGHYIGRHRDSVRGLIPDSLIVTISLGEERAFRLRPYEGRGFTDLPLVDGAVVIVPLATNERWKHEVPASKRRRGRRVSVTLRSFA